MASPALWRLARNDLTGARAFVRALGRPLTPDEGHVLLMLFDDPAPLLRALRAPE